MIPFWCGVLHRRADLAEERQSFRQAEPVLVAVVGERDALDQLHDEERPAAVGGAGVEDPGDVRVVHQRQGLPLGLEPGEHRPRIHARLDQLERDLPLDRLRLFGEVDAPHPPFADLLAELVPARDHAADGRVGHFHPGLSEKSHPDPDVSCFVPGPSAPCTAVASGSKVPTSQMAVGRTTVGSPRSWESSRASTSAPTRDHGQRLFGRGSRPGRGMSRASRNRISTRRGSSGMGGRS